MAYALKYWLPVKDSRASRNTTFQSTRFHLQTTSEIPVSLQTTLLHRNGDLISFQLDCSYSGRRTNMYNSSVGLECCVRLAGLRYLDGRSGEALCMSRWSYRLVPFICDCIGLRSIASGPTRLIDVPVPQCFIIGLSQFTRYTEDVKDHVINPMSHHSYADDTQMLAQATIQSLASRVLGAWDSHIVRSTLMCSTASSAESRQEGIHIHRIDWTSAATSMVSSSSLLTVFVIYRSWSALGQQTRHAFSRQLRLCRLIFFHLRLLHHLRHMGDRDFRQRLFPA